ncbi:MAG: glucosidase, partial [Cyanobacteria bacterium J06632_3]
MKSPELTPEHRRLQESDPKAERNWKKWGPYLSERQWGTVREDYSAQGEAWDYFPHEQARSRAYRWGEDGILGLCDDRQLLCFALALWNTKDPILKERFFGLTGNEGNHGEDVKEYYFYLDSTPTHSYMKALYKYPQAAFPYQQLVEENRARDRHQPEYELIDTGIFADNRYFDVQIEYAKADTDDTLILISVTNRGPDAADLSVLPTLWFRNTWSWSNDGTKPQIKLKAAQPDLYVVESSHPELGKNWLYGLSPDANNNSTDFSNSLLFTENETNKERLFDVESASPYVKDAFHRYIIDGEQSAVNPEQTGTKTAAHYQMHLASGETREIRLRLANRADIDDPLGESFTATFHTRQEEADKFYHHLSPFIHTEDLKNVQRQAFAGMMWGKQYYLYDVATWIKGDENTINPPTERLRGRNHHWHHLDSQDILSMPDTWEYPWFAAWDTAFHCIPLAMIDPEFAKQQLDVMTREWYMHPNGQLPAYEWAFDDVNPPVHAWATWRIYKIERKMTGKGDRLFLERLFQKLLLN